MLIPGAVSIRIGIVALLRNQRLFMKCFLFLTTEFCPTKTVVFLESVNVIAPGEGDLADTVKGWEADLELSR